MEEITNKSFKKGLWLFLILFVVFLGLNMLVGIYLYPLALYHEVIDILIPCLIYLLVIKKPILSTLKLDKKINKKSIVIVFQLFLISFLLKLGINYLVILTGLIDPSRVTMEVMDLAPDFFTLFFAVAIMPSFLEEIIIRGVVLDQFKDTSLWQGAIMTGLLFGFMHVDIGQLGYTTALGIIMGAIVIITGSLWGGVFFHFLNNFTSVVTLSFLQFIENTIPSEFEQIIAEAQTQSTANISIVEGAYSFVFAVVCLSVGIMLSLHYIKRLQKVNESTKETPLEEGIFEENEYEEIKSHKKVSWKSLFFNMPFFLIVLVYVGVNLIR